MSRMSYPSAVIFIFTVVSLFIRFDAAAGEVFVGSFTMVKGDVILKKPGRELPVKALKGMSFSIGDTIEADKGGMAQAEFIDSSFVNISESTVLGINQYIYEKSSKRRVVELALLKGVARFVVMKRQGRGSQFRVSTDSAGITAALADFVVSAGIDETEVSVLNRAVIVKNVSTLIVGEVRLNAGYEAVVRKKTAPMRPYLIAKEKKESLLRRLTELRH